MLRSAPPAWPLTAVAVGLLAIVIVEGHGPDGATADATDGATAEPFAGSTLSPRSGASAPGSVPH